MHLKGIYVTNSILCLTKGNSERRTHTHSFKLVAKVRSGRRKISLLTYLLYYKSSFITHFHCTHIKAYMHMAIGYLPRIYFQVEGLRSKSGCRCLQPHVLRYHYTSPIFLDSLLEHNNVRESCHCPCGQLFLLFSRLELLQGLLLSILKGTEFYRQVYDANMFVHQTWIFLDG